MTPSNLFLIYSSPYFLFFTLYHKSTLHLLLKSVPMDREEEEEMQFLGIFGIYKEAFKIIAKCKRIFTQITLTLIIPLSIIFLLYQVFSSLLYGRMQHTHYIIQRSHPRGSYSRYNRNINAERLYYWLLKLAYYIAVLIFSLLSTSAVVYTIASLYTAKEITFKRIMNVVPKIWKRLLVTFLCMFLAFFIYHGALTLVILLIVVTLGDTNGFVPVFIILLIVYAIGFVYMTIVWQLASVISVLEKIYGFKAVLKAKNLIKGKMRVAIAIFLKLNIFFVGIQIAFAILVVSDIPVYLLSIRVPIGFACFVLLFLLILFGLVVQTVFYFVCKSFHHENINKSALSNHLEVIYLGEYAPLKEKDVQLQQSQV